MRWLQRQCVSSSSDGRGGADVNNPKPSDCQNMLIAYLSGSIVKPQREVCVLLPASTWRRDQPLKTENSKLQLHTRL